MLRRRRRPGCRRDDEEEEQEGNSSAAVVALVLVFVAVARCIYWHGRGQRLCRGCWRRLSDCFFVVAFFDVDISSSCNGVHNGDALALVLRPVAPGLQAQARQGRAVPVPYGREELHAGDGAR